MCGVFGSCGTAADVDLLQEIALLAGTRGPHAHEIFWTDSRGSHIRKEIGRIRPEILKNVMPALLIGHCRLSTSGSYRMEQNNQPIICGDIAVSHNGNIPDYLEIAREKGITLSTCCDSEILCHLAGRYGVQNAITATKGAPTALLLLQNNKMTVFRRRLPLYALHTDGGYYFCSRSFRDAAQIPENEELTFEGGITDGNMQHETR